MNHSEATLEAITPSELADVTGAGIGTQIGSLFGAKGQQWGGLADNILGILGGLGGGGGGGAPSGGAPAAGG